ncbi:MAG: DUF3558 domain-containing protein [Gordonia sp. (in: high G+C Gram-positive bacteria)]
MTVRRTWPVILCLLVVIGLVAGCSRTIDGVPLSAQEAQSRAPGEVNTDDFDQLTLECEVLRPDQIADTVGGSAAEGIFFGANCRWLVSGAVTAYVTFNWFEWGSLTVEKNTAKKLGYETETIKISGQTAFTQRHPGRATVCGVSTRAPSRGVYTFWVEPVAGASGDPCDAPTRLMKLLLSGGQ